MSAYLDTRDLDDELDELQERADQADEAADDEESDGDNLIDEDERERLAALVALRDDIGSEWRHGVTLISDSEFEEYARDYADDVGNISDWVAPYVDWSAFADALRSDYSSVEFDGETYWYRS